MKNFIAHVQLLNIFLSRTFFTHDGFSLKHIYFGFHGIFSLFDFFYVFKDYPMAHFQMKLKLYRSLAPSCRMIRELVLNI